MEPSDGSGHLTTEELFRQYSDFVARFLARLGVPSGQLEDAVQEVFLVVHRNGGYRPGIAKPTSYLGNIAVRAAAQHRRRQGAALARHSEAVVERMPGGTEDPAHALQVQQDLQRLQLALERLPEDLRTVLLLVEMEGESCVSVAAGLGCPVGTVYWRLHQARRKLQSGLARIDAPRRRAEPQATPVRLEERTASRGTFMLIPLFPFDRSEAARLLQVAREQPTANPQLEAQLARHQQLVEAGTPLPPWASELVPHGASWGSVLGLGPVAAGAAAISALAVVVALLPTGASPEHTAKVVAPVAAQPQPAAIAPARAQPPGDVASPTAPTAQVAPPAAPTAQVAPPAASTRGPSPEVSGAAPTSTAHRAEAAATVGGAQALRGEGVRGTVAAASVPETGAEAGGLDGSETGRVGRADPARETSPSERPQPAAADRSQEAARRAEQPTPRPRAGREAAVAQPSEPKPTRATEPPPEPAPDPNDPSLVEIRQVAQAERLLATDPARALAMTRQMRARFGAGYLGEERAYVEVMALHRLGRSQEMRKHAGRFLRAYPRGPYAHRVRRAIASMDATP